MASEFSAVKHQSGVWNANQSANLRSGAAKLDKNTPNEIKIGVYNIGNQNSNGECSSAVQPVKCDISSDFQNVNKQASALSPIDMSMLLTNVLYGAALPFQFAANQTGAGAMPNFGLFPPFGLTFPTLPISSISQTPNAGIHPPPFSKVKPPIPRNGKPKITKTIANKETKTISAVRSVSQTAAAASNASITQQLLGNQSHAAIASLFPVTNKHGGGQRKQSLQNGATEDLRKKSPSYVTYRGTKTPQSLRVKSTTSSTKKTGAKSAVDVPSKRNYGNISSNGSMRVANGGHSNATHILPTTADIGQYAKQLAEYGHSPNSHVHKTGKYQFDFSLRELPIAIQVSGSPASNRNHVNYTAKNITQWYLPKHITHTKDLRPRNSEAEVADILLGLRNTVVPSVCEAYSSHIQVNTQLNSEMRRRVDASSSFHKQPRNIVYSTAQAMDLTKKNTSSDQHIQTVRHVTQSSTSQPVNGRNSTSVSFSCRPTLPNSITVNKQQRRSVPIVASRDYDSSPSANNLRHFLFPSKPAETTCTRITKTSAVSHPDSCICAFDCPSQIECLHTTGYDASEELKSQQAAAAVGGFNFKKVFCRKFTQSIGSEPDDQHCWDVDSGDDTHNSVFDPIVTSKISNEDVVLNIADQSARIYPKSDNYGEIQHDKPLRSRILPLSSKEPSILIRDGHCDVMPAEHAIDFRVKKRSSSARKQNADDEAAQKSLKRSKANKVSQEDICNKSHMTSSSTARLHAQSEVHQRIAGSEQENGVKNAQSFKDLREKSRQIESTSKDSAKCAFSHSPSFESYSKSTKNNEKVKNSNMPTSNLYRIRNSIGDSNESLNTVESESETKAEDSDASDSSCSSYESDDCSARERSGARSSCSDGESDQDLSDTEEVMSVGGGGVSPDENFRKCPQSSRSSPIARSKFVLNKPKFTLASSSFSTTFQKQLSDGHTSESILPNSANESPSTTNKVKIRRPTFKFSSDSVVQSSSKKLPSNIPSQQVSKTAATNDTNAEHVPELKCDGEEDSSSTESFKAKLIRALSTYNQKIAVDGKSLKALLGEATSFYHNDRKYVLKRYLTKTKTKEGFIAGVTDTSTILSSPVDVASPSLHDSNNNVNTKTTSNNVSSTMEPRVSVTATKRTGYNKSVYEEHNSSNPVKYLKEKGETKCTSDDEIVSKNDGYTRIVSYQSTARKIMSHKRHKRIHEIDKLVFEGAGAGTPLPDMSLRDSDVFSNIKLRRREAAKRGIAGSNVADDRTAGRGKVKILSKKSRENRFQKTVAAARQRAEANKTRKHSIAQKLRKYKKRSSWATTSAFAKKSQQLVAEKPRITCVRINAGIPRPRHDSLRALAAAEIIKNPDDYEENVTVDRTNDESVRHFDVKVLECFRKRKINDEPTNDEIKVEKHASTDVLLGSRNTTEELYTPSDEYNKDHSHCYASSAPKYIGDHGNADDQEAHHQLCPDSCNSYVKDDGEEDGSKSSMNCDNEWDEMDIVPLSKYKEDIKKKMLAETPEKERRYPKRSIKPKQSSAELNSQPNDKQAKKTSNESDATSETASTTNSCCWENDSVRSENSLASNPPKTVPGIIRKKNQGLGQGGRTSPLSSRVKAASSRTCQDSVVGKKCTFRLLSCFPVPAAITLGPASCDLQPSYSVKNFPQRGCLISGNNHSSLTWKIGSDARETKLQLQRECWRNMTLDMFNGGASAKVKSMNKI